MKPALLPRAQITRNNVGQVAHESPTLWVTSQGSDISGRALEAACWLWLGCWSNNAANSHLSPGLFNHRIMRSCLVPQCSQPPYWPRHQRRLANCDLMPASCIAVDNLPILAGIQHAEPHRNEATLSLARLAMESGHLLHPALTYLSSANARRLKSRHPPHNNPPVYLTTIYVRRSRQITNGILSGRTTCKTPRFHLRHRHPRPRNDPPKNSLGPA